MSDNEYEAFEINDYDLENEFNPNRHRRKPTKNQQIYGIWADDSEDSVELPTFSSNRRQRASKSQKSRNKIPNDYSAPVSFVAGGIQQSGKDKKPTEQIDDDISQITDDEDDLAELARKNFKDNHQGNNSSSESEEEKYRSSNKPCFGRKNFESSEHAPSRMAAWQQHTKGIGAKLLLQMGYEPGKGLGKTLQGIAQPVEAHVRKGRGAIGAYGPEKNASIGGQPAPQIANIDIDKIEAKEFDVKINQWKKDDKSSKGVKSRYYYRTPQEVIEKGKKSTVFSDQYRYKHQYKKLNRSSLKSQIYSISNRLSNVTVIDMTGPEKRVLSSYQALNQVKFTDDNLYENRLTKQCKNFNLPELMHNLNLIVDMCENEIISIDKIERRLENRQRELEHDKENLEKLYKLETNHLETLINAQVTVEKLIYPKDGILTLETAEKYFLQLKIMFAAEFTEFGLNDLVGGIIAPLINTELKQWKPLDEPRRFLELIQKWKSILGENYSQEPDLTQPYSCLIWSGVVPHFRACISEWDVKNYQKLGILLDIWGKDLLSWVIDNILEQMVLPRLMNEVAIWDPLTDTVPIHIWILPWSALLAHKMEEYIYPTIREKLSYALQMWMPHDRSALAMLAPWNGVFDDGQMQAFLVQYIIPKLQMTLHELIINPMLQDLEIWNQVIEWNEIVPRLLMVQLLNEYFFPKWMQTLVIWLNQSPDLEQISKWYLGWKIQIPENLLGEVLIKEHFRRALELMQRVSGASLNIPQQQQTPVPPSSSTNSPVSVSAIPPPALMDLQIPPPPQIEFKELVSQKCAERGIIFVPMPGRREFGKQVYRTGKLFCYIDRAVLMVTDGSFKNWLPISLASLLEKAVTG